MNLKLSNQTIEFDPKSLTEEDKKKLIEVLEDDTWPNKGDEYFYIDYMDNLEIGNTYWLDCSMDNDLKNVGDCFRTKEEAEKHITYLKALQVLKGDTKGYEWKCGDEFYSVAYHPYRRDLIIECGTASYGEPVKFRTEEDAEESIKLHEKEWRIVLIGEDK